MTRENLPPNMSERIISSSVGLDVSVEVYFDFEPEEQQTRDHPGCAAEVTINRILVDGDKGKDLFDDLSSDTIERLEQDCFESLNTED